MPWFKAWQIGAGMDPNKKQQIEKDRKEIPRMIGGAAIASFLFACGLQVLIHSVGADNFLAGMCAGLVA